ncbi:MAG: hypothetical protein AAGG44_09775 [Planctomycetota bacterium]
MAKMNQQPIEAATHVPPKRRVRPLRLGVTTTEALISAIILAITVSMLSSFAVTTRQGLEDRELSARIDWELVNLRERIGTWEPGQITVAAIEAIPVSKVLGERFEESRFTADIKDIGTPIASKQITLAIECKRKGQQIRPAELTFWVKQVADTEKPAAEANDSAKVDDDDGSAEADVEQDQALQGGSDE